MHRSSPLNVCQMAWGDPVPMLDSSDIHIWLLPLTPASADQYVLSTEDWTRAGRFRFDRDRDRWIAARVMLRSLLGWYTFQAPSTVRLDYTPYGKPFLPDFPNICFNLSHAGDYGLLAVAQGRAVGVDIERIRLDFADSSVAQHFFSEAEQTILATIPPDEYAHAFFTCWTRKESYIKARGDGLSHPLQDFDVALEADAPELLLATRPNAGERECWHMQALNVPEGYLAAFTISKCACPANLGSEPQSRMNGFN